ncbi:MAG: M90 family metallopeptidase [Chitinophagaceae bacterium]
MQIIMLLFSLVVIAVIFYATLKKPAPLPQPAVEVQKQLLDKHVHFYRNLSPEEKLRFENAVHKFLLKIRITGVQTTVEDLDTVLIAAGAIIPIFAFRNWEYKNIHEVLLYPGSFNNEYRIAGEGRNTLGMVGNGPMQHVMILSKQDLRNGFINQSDKSNTAIHEFVHLVDKSDGDIDGLPEALLQHKYTLPWLKRIHEEIQQIGAGRSDIDRYAATNDAEFLAVAAEYFFEQPDLMQQKHPALFGLLEQIFTPEKLA